MWIHLLNQLNGCLAACLAFIFAKVVVAPARKLIEGPIRKALGRKPSTSDKLFLAPQEVPPSLLLPNLTPPLFSLTLHSTHLSLYIVSHDHHLLHLIHPTSFNQSSTFFIYHRCRVFPASRRDKLHQSIQHYHYHLIISHSALRIDCSNLVIF